MECRRRSLATSSMTYRKPVYIQMNIYILKQIYDIEETVGEVLIEGRERCDEGLFGMEAVVDDKHELGALGHAAEHLPVVCVYY